MKSKLLKLTLYFLATVVLLLSMIGCQDQGQGDGAPSETQSSSTLGNTDETINNDSIFYSYESMYSYLKPRFCIDFDTLKGSCSDSLVQEFVSQYTTERSLPVGERSTCSIYQIQSEGGVQGYLVMFFETVGPCFRRTNEYYFFSEALSQSQLADLKVGDDLTALYNLDPSIYFDLTQVGRLISVDGTNDVIYKPLKDGILKLRVYIPAKTDEGISYDPSDYKIREIEFYSYGEDLGYYVTILPSFSEDDIAWLFAK